MRQLLLLSNSRDAEGRYLHHAARAITRYTIDVQDAVFIPYADVSREYDVYRTRAQSGFDAARVTLHSIHESTDPVAMLASAPAIVIGGGNTFQLLQLLHEHSLIEPIRQRVHAGAPYIGWSAGSVVACPSLKTTNDMPIIEPRSFDALSLVSFQINAHFTDAHPAGFQGETRRQRIGEFLHANPGMPVVGLPEGDWLEVRGDEITLRGEHPAPFFRAGNDAVDLLPDHVVHHLLTY
jgi:dipeptidase E